MSSIQLKVWGDFACFTRPEMKVERVSYDVMTPSAARGVLEAILWKPAIKWVIDRIDVLEPVKWLNVRRNEVSEVLSVRNAKTVINGGSASLAIDIEDARQQRAGLILRDVAYVIHAHFELTDKAGTGDSPTKFRQMFERRARKGQCFHRPYLGCREFAANFEWINGDELPQPIAATTDLGFMLHDISYGKSGNDACFFRAELDNGAMKIPTLNKREVRA